MLLVDENLPPQLAHHLQSVFPGIVTVQRLGLAGVSDQRIWKEASAREMIHSFCADDDGVLLLLPENLMIVK